MPAVSGYQTTSDEVSGYQTMSDEAVLEMGLLCQLHPI